MLESRLRVLGRGNRAHEFPAEGGWATRPTLLSQYPRAVAVLRCRARALAFASEDKAPLRGATGRRNLY